MKGIYLLSIVSFGVFAECNAAKILGISWYPATSHQMMFQPIWRELSLRGHQVTIITPVPMRDEALTNLTEIDVSFLFNAREKSNIISRIHTGSWIWNLVVSVKLVLTEYFDAMLENNDVKALINSNKTFDVVIGEPHSALIFAFGERFKAPVIGKYCLKTHIAWPF